jgi:exopolyphosphatase/guanosine-5'-triphosphate,3'-diphosphate pyrophosphatase
MRVAIIDLGTNSVRFDVHQIGAAGSHKRLHREKLLIKLGQDVFLTGKLDRAAMDRTMQAFLSFRDTAKHFNVSKVVAFGTSALREASDSDKLLSRIKAKTGIDVRIISGKEEAKYIANGILNNEKKINGKFALVDIGGGSTEISLCQNKSILHSESFQLGTARLQQVFLKSVPPIKKNAQGRSSIDALRSHLKSVLLTHFISEDWPSVPLIVGSSGTIRTLGRILRKKNKDTFSTDDLSQLVKRMSTMNVNQLLLIPGMDSKRVEMILAGSILLEEVAKALKAKKIRVTDFSLRDGIIDEELKVVRLKKSTSLAFHIPELVAKAEQIGVNPVHAKTVLKLAELLFDQLKPLHRLAPSWKPYLQAAAVLHDTGEAISPTGHAEHSYYIVNNAHFSSMTEDETKFVALLCLHHSGAKAQIDEAILNLDPSKTTVFYKLLSILRIADALDRSHKGYIQSLNARIHRQYVEIRVNTKSSCDLELLRVEQKKALFERIFKKRLTLIVGRRTLRTR